MKQADWALVRRGMERHEGCHASSRDGGDTRERDGGCGWYRYRGRCWLCGQGVRGKRGRQARDAVGETLEGGEGGDAVLAKRRRGPWSECDDGSQ